MRKLVLSWMAALSLAFAESVWNAANQFGVRGEVRHCKAELIDDNLVFTDIALDMSQTFLNTAIDPATSTAFVYKYRATGTATARGQIFYAHDNERFSDTCHWNLPALQSDGEWHTVTVYESAILERQKWFNQGPISSIRLDLTDGAGGKIELAEFRFIKADEPAKPAPAKPAPTKPAAPAPVMTTEKPIWGLENGFPGDRKSVV